MNKLFLKQSIVLSSAAVLFTGSIAISQPLKISLVPDSINTTTSDTAKSIDSTSTVTKPAVISNDSLATSAIATAPPLLPEPGSSQKNITIDKSWSYTLPMYITGIKICDVNNDKQMETVIVSGNKVQFFQYQNKSFTQFTEYEAPLGTQCISIDAADLNKNGVPELFITACDAGSKSITSFIGELENNKFKILQKRIPYMLRAIELSDTNTILLGQTFSDAGVNYGSMYVLSYNNGKYSKKDAFPFERDHALLSMSAFRNRKDTTSQYLCYSSKGNIEIFNIISLRKELESADHFSGNSNYLLLPSNDDGDENRSYLPLRALSADFNNDGIDEIVAIKNYELTNNIISSFKVYMKFHIEIFSQTNNLTLTSIWKSTKFDGFISDGAYGDYNNDGKKELLLVKVLKTDATVLRKPLTEITAFTIK